MRRMKKIGIVCCSNGQREMMKPQLQRLGGILNEMQIEPVYGECLYEKDGVRSGTGKERAEALMLLYKDDSVSEIFDISGGDIANEVLPYLDYEQIANSNKMFFGYSDLTTVINAIYTKAGKESGLYQLRNLLDAEGEKQKKQFKATFVERKTDLIDFQYQFLQGEKMEGIVVGGNIRCFLKLAGTEYFPDLDGKILLLEACGGELPQIITYFSQLSQMGVFQRVKGILLGTFTKLEAAGGERELERLVLEFAEKIPVAKTSEIGHGADSKCCMIGRKYRFTKNR